MSDYKINTNYAKALFLLASDMQQLDAVMSDMRLVNEVCRENRELGVVFNNPVIPEGKKVAILDDLFASHLSHLSMAFMHFVVKKRRAINLRGISNAYMEMHRNANNVILTDLVTAVEVDEESKAEVTRLVAEYTGKNVELQSRTDDKMLGGFCMRFDNNMYDARIRTKIMKLRQEFEKNIYESKL